MRIVGGRHVGCPRTPIPSLVADVLALVSPSSRPHPNHVRPSRGNIFYSNKKQVRLVKSSLVTESARPLSTAFGRDKAKQWATFWFRCMFHQMNWKGGLETQFWNDGGHSVCYKGCARTNSPTNRAITTTTNVPYCFWFGVGQPRDTGRSSTLACVFPLHWLCRSD